MNRSKTRERCRKHLWSDIFTSEPEPNLEDFEVQELQNALHAERLAREQGDHRCLEALRELREDRWDCRGLGIAPLTF